MARLNDDERRTVLNRLARIEGQVRGLRRMVEEDKYCVDILTQISAATTALDRVGLQILDGHVHGCVGEAMEREGDYFGRTVNIAARVSALASAGEVLVTDEVVEAAGQVESVRFIERGRHPLKGIEDPVLIYLASPGAQESPEGLPIDPVCHMAVDPERAAGMIVHEGTRYHFCSVHCVRRFAAEPEGFV